MDADLILAVQNNEKSEVQTLLRCGANPNAKDEEMDTAAIIWAASSGQQDIVELLLTHGANIKARNDMGWNALMSAMESINSYERVAPANYLLTMKLLLNHGIGVNEKDNYGGTALLPATESGDTAVVTLFISNGANVNAADKDGKTSLMIASERGYEKGVAVLLEAGASVRLKDKDGRTALDWTREPIAVGGWGIPGPSSDVSLRGESMKRYEKAMEQQAQRIRIGHEQVRKLLNAATNKNKQPGTTIR